MVNHNQLEKLGKLAYTCKLPLFVWGTMGIGKSDTARALARDLANGKDFCEGYDPEKFSLIDVRVSQLEPSDLRGIPVVEEGVTKWKYPNWLPRTGSGIIFLDELNLAPMSIQAACYQLILDRKLGDYKLPDGYIVMAAGNRTEDKANVFDMPAPLANRLMHCTLDVPDHNQWTDWALKNNVESRVISFIQFQPSSLFKFDYKSKSKAFPTPRSWAALSKMVKGVKDYDTLSLIAESCVGEGVGKQFVAFCKLEDKISIDNVLENPETELPKITELSLKYSVVCSLVDHYALDKRKNLQNVLKCSLYMEPEFAKLMLKMCRSKDANLFDKEGLRYPEFDKVAEKYSKYILG